MAERNIIYSNVTRAQLQSIQQALVAAGIAIHSLPPPSLHSRQFDAGGFNTNGYDVSYRFLPSDSTGQVGTLTATVSGSLLFIGKAVNKLDAHIRPYLT